MRNNNVIIIGSGVAGLAASLFLKKAGIASTIYESRSDDVETGAGFLLSPNGVKILKEIGCMDDVMANAIVIKRINQINSDNELEATFHNYSEKYYHAPLLNVMRDQIIKSLLKEVQRQGIKVTYNKKFTSVKQTSHSVEVLFEDETVITGDIVIGADGTFSKTREAVAFNAKLDYSGFWGLQGISYVEDFVLEEATSYFYNDGNFQFIFGKAHPTNKMNILWQAFSQCPEKLPTKHFEKASKDNIRKLLYKQMDEWNIPKHLVEIIDHTDMFFPRSIYEIKHLPVWSKGRVVLIGDAVHTANPFVGQGASYSLEDAMVIAKMLRDHDYRDAFYYYEQDRRKRTEELNALFQHMSIQNDIDKKMNEYNIEWDEETYV
ncbi:FAD-dependent monooxygenase [Bacillus sp. 28A-2]|uniref:FAD-dependent oxidoreductase n=1 Tax=Bacillus sp. 28A-2 TaxID=2772252 RepID=UPI00168CB892|nr:NAD(P)/FAD-dependent oxidoreductase [Bacillus sp. 28A-2]MBD3861688.1 FAD-dependent monooxygenase [Bacillus sp. 28A-2]